MAAAVFGEIDQFDLDDDQAKSMWEEWCERMDQFLIANGLDKTQERDKPRCKAIFLSRVGSKCYSLIRTLCHPNKPDTKTLEQLQQLVKDHLSPAPIVIAERYVFYNRRQTADESVAEFLKALRKLAETCNFGDFRNDALRDIFVIGLRDRETQKKLLSEQDLTLENALNKAQAAERTRLHVDNMAGEVHKVQLSGKKNKSFRHKEPTSSKACFTCGQVGHFKAQCPKNREQHKPVNQSKHKYKKNKVHKVDQTQSQLPCSSSEAESDEDYDRQLCAVRVSKVSQLARVPQYLVQMKVNDQPLELEIDTGASVSIISHKEFKKLNLGNLVTCHIELSTITGEKLSVVGKCNVSVEYCNQYFDNLCLAV
jgi:hypothetical protein